MYVCFVPAIIEVKPIYMGKASTLPDSYFQHCMGTFIDRNLITYVHIQYIYIHIYIYTHTYIYMLSYIYIYTHVYMHTYIHIYTYIHVSQVVYSRNVMLTIVTRLSFSMS